MAVDSKVEITGLAALFEDLDAMVKSVEDEVIDLVARETAEVLQRAIESAPVVDGLYKAGIESEITRGGLVGRVIGRDEKSHWVEYGTFQQGGQPVITGALDSRRDSIAAETREIANNARI
jgi:HK97 gp10 family phage protein